MIFGKTSARETINGILTLPFNLSPVENSTISMSTRDKTDGLPVSAPTKSWYKNPMIIMGISMGGIFALCILPAVILVVLTRKWKRKVRVGIAGSADSSDRPTPDGVVKEDLEMENLESVLRGDHSK